MLKKAKSSLKMRRCGETYIEKGIDCKLLLTSLWIMFHVAFPFIFSVDFLNVS